jgi:hypothetical protein
MNTKSTTEVTPRLCRHQWPLTLMRQSGNREQLRRRRARLRGIVGTSVFSEIFSAKDGL